MRLYWSRKPFIGNSSRSTRKCWCLIIIRRTIMKQNLPNRCKGSKNQTICDKSSEIRLICIIIILSSIMASVRGLKTIRKPYPPQIAVCANELFIYTPLEHWVQQHSSNSIKDIVQIEGPASPFFMNCIEESIVLQSEHCLMTHTKNDECFSLFKKNYCSEKAIASKTAKLKNKYYFNINEAGSFNMWEIEDLDENQCAFEESNPESFKDISKASWQKSFQEKCINVETDINVDTLLKKYRNGYNLADIELNQDRLLTLHKFQYQQDACTRIYQTDVSESRCYTSAFRDYLPGNIQSVFGNGNSIWAYGGDNLLLLDRRTGSVVVRLNNLPDSSVNYVRKHDQKQNSLYVCRDGYLLMQDVRRPHILDILVNEGQNIESFEILHEDGVQIYCLSLEFDNKVVLCQKKSCF